jgi:hypothetical protein
LNAKASHAASVSEQAKASAAELDVQKQAAVKARNYKAAQAVVSRVNEANAAAAKADATLSDCKLKITKIEADLESLRV